MSKWIAYNKAETKLKGMLQKDLQKTSESTMFPKVVGIKNYQLISRYSLSHRPRPVSVAV